MVKQCVILAAGKNTRLDTGKPKSLLEINGKSLLERHICEFGKNGVEAFCVITGHNPEPIREEIIELKSKYNVQIDITHNERYDLENGFSLSAAEQWISSQGAECFLLTMGDHVFQDSFVVDFSKLLKAKKVKESLCLAVDIPSAFNEHIDIDDVTKVEVDQSGKILKIGKNLDEYNRYDTGLFCMRPQVFQILRDCFDAGKYSISDMVSRLILDGEALTLDVIDHLWNDVDNHEDLKNSSNLNFSN